MRLTVTVEQDDITKEIGRIFDYEFDGTTGFDVPQIDGLPERFSVGLIVGPSGSGKSSLLGKFGTETQLEWNPEKSVASHFASAEEARTKLSAVGFNSIPSWLRPYHVLSTGEKFRASIARALESGAVIDEFTSVVDRNVAKSCAKSVRDYVDRIGLHSIVIASCHYDIIEWLRPDWVFDTSTKTLTLGRDQRRPEIVLELVPCSPKAWSLFRDHHYLDGNINKSSRCWLAVWEGTVVGFSSAIAFPSGTIKNAWREHRTVVLPDFQGMGFGVRISDATAEMFVRNGHRYFSKTAHPRMGEYRNNSAKWKPTSKNKMVRKDYYGKPSTKEGKHQLRHADRFCFSHEYIGQSDAVQSRSIPVHEEDHHPTGERVSVHDANDGL